MSTALRSLPSDAAGTAEAVLADVNTLVDRCVRERPRPNGFAACIQTTCATDRSRGLPARDAL